MQTYEAFKLAFQEQRSQIGPGPGRRSLHLLPVGRIDENLHALIGQVQRIFTAFFMPLRVSVLRRVAGGPWKSDGPDGALDAEAVLRWMAGSARSDSVLTLAVTTSLLRIRGEVTIGASDWDTRIGLVSIKQCLISTSTVCSCNGAKGEAPIASTAFARSLSPLDSGVPSSEGKVGWATSPATPPVLPQLALERVLKLLTHQALHLLGLLHCCYFRCLMNGASGLEEFDSKPPYLCGMCLKKLHLVIGFDPLERYGSLAKAWAATGGDGPASWYATRCLLMQDRAAGAQSASSTPCGLRSARQTPSPLQWRERGTSSARSTPRGLRSARHTPSPSGEPPHP